MITATEHPFVDTVERTRRADTGTTTRITRPTPRMVETGVQTHSRVMGAAFDWQEYIDNECCPVTGETLREQLERRLNTQAAGVTG